MYFICNNIDLLENEITHTQTKQDFHPKYRQKLNLKFLSKIRTQFTKKALFNVMSAHGISDEMFKIVCACAKNDCFFESLRIKPAKYIKY